MAKYRNEVLEPNLRKRTNTSTGSVHYELVIYHGGLARSQSFRDLTEARRVRARAVSAGLIKESSRSVENLLDQLERGEVPTSDPMKLARIRERNADRMAKPEAQLEARRREGLKRVAQREAEREPDSSERAQFRQLVQQRAEEQHRRKAEEAQRGTL